MREILPDGPEILRDSAGKSAPDLVRYAMEFANGDVYSRTGLDQKTRQIAIIATLTAMGNVPSQLGNHIKFGLNTGMTRDEVIEVITQMVVYAGFPAALNAAVVAQEAFDQVDGKAE